MGISGLNRPAPTTQRFLRVLGPGLLLGALSVGVSHLVQATRAGAEYGLVMLVFIFLAIATKYPTFRFAPRYTIATGDSMVEGFRRRGRWALWLFAVVIASHMFVGIAAVTYATAGILNATFRLDFGAKPTAAALLGGTAIFLLIGRYRWLDLLTKPLIVVMTVSTVLAALLAAPLIDWSEAGNFRLQQLDMHALVFAAALIGWMPAPLEGAVVHSLWLQARISDTGYRPSIGEAGLDFHIGYVLTFLLAVCFLLLGTAIMYGSGIELEESTVGFAAQLINLYEETLGPWSRALIGAAALAVMYSTLIAALDGLSRACARLIFRIVRPDEPDSEIRPKAWAWVYNICVAGIGAGAMAILVFFAHSFRSLIDVATTISFVTTPVLAFLVHRSIRGREVAKDIQPGRWMSAFSAICIGLLALFACGYLVLLIGGHTG